MTPMQATIIVLFVAFVVWALIDAALLLRDIRDELAALRREINQSKAAKWR